nr:uncharacterized protein LOC100344728 isoform X1 [Oryctolagus cuniculus]
MSHPDYRLNLRPLGTPRGVSSVVSPRGGGASPGDRKSKNKSTRGKKKSVFETYLSKEDVSEGLKRGTLIQGILRINPKKFHEAFIPSPDGDRDIFIDGVVARNRALNGDVVVVRLLPEEQWKGNFDLPGLLHQHCLAGWQEEASWEESAHPHAGKGMFSEIGPQESGDVDSLSAVICCAPPWYARMISVFPRASDTVVELNHSETSDSFLRRAQGQVGQRCIGALCLWRLPLPGTWARYLIKKFCMGMHSLEKER